MSATIQHDAVTMRFIERQLRSWEIGRSQRIEQTPPERVGVAQCICLSREAGAGGSEVAKTLSERLDWPLFDKDILRVMAGDDALRHRVYNSMDERDLNWCEEALRAFMDSDFRKNDYFHQLTKTVLSLARQANTIFVGRGADRILPPESGMRVRLVAPLDMRVERIAERMGVSKAKAKDLAEQQDAERAMFIRKHFHVEANDPHRYDLVLNLRHISIPQCADLVLATAKAMSIC